MTVQQIDDVVRQIVDDITFPPRTPSRYTPAERGLTYETVTFRAEDGIPLEGWFVPAADVAPVVIVNHPGGSGRTGTGENLAADIRILHDAGYHVLAYDLRNHGRSGTADDGAASYGVAESRDVIGSLRWVRSNIGTIGTPIGVFGVGAGVPATFFALSRAPEEFAGVRCLVGGRPLSVRSVVDATMALLGIEPGRIGEVDDLLRDRAGYRMEDVSPLPVLGDVRIPTFLYQSDDLADTPGDAQAMYDHLPAGDKELVRTDGRDASRYFRRHPSRILTWLDYHLT